MKKYFQSNETDFARKASKWLTILLGILTPISVSNVLHGNWLHWTLVSINIVTLIIKLLIPFTGSDATDIQELQKNQITQIPQ